jgi:hypothetical protein
LANKVTDAILFAVPVQTDIPGTGGLNLLTDTNAAPHKFYRVGVKAR